LVTLRFHVLDMLIIIAQASRKLLPTHVKVPPSAAWTLPPLREAILSDHPYRFLIHDRDRMFSQSLDKSLCKLRSRVLKTSPLTPQANGTGHWQSSLGLFGLSHAAEREPSSPTEQSMG
jgi:hypothetical protein